MENIKKVGYAFDKNFEYEYICIKKSHPFVPFVWGFGVDDNSVDEIEEAIKGDDYICSVLKSSVHEIHSLRNGEVFSVNGVIIICIKGDK